MRLFSEWKYVFSNAEEETVDEVASALQNIEQPVIKQTIENAGSISGEIEAGDTVVILTAHPLKDHLIDLSCSGDLIVTIVSGSGTNVIPLMGTIKLPSRLAVTLKAGPTEVSITNRGSSGANYSFLTATFIDNADPANFPVV